MSAWCCVVIMFTTMSHGALLKNPQQTEEKEIYDRHYWYAQAEQTLQKRLQYATDKKPIAKNIILVVGDGMSLTTTTAARILRGQRKGLPGEDTDLVWDTFPAVALAKTYNIDAQTGESSACATALLCGVKARYETLGIDAGGRFNNCASTIDTKVTSLIDWAHAAGKSSGIVTTSRVTHATPAALYAHSPSRFWEDDSRVPPTVRRDCKDIALQLLENEPGKSIKVIMGGGRRHFLSTISTDPEYPDKEGKRLDGRNLAEDWVRDKKKKRQRAQYIYSKDQLAKVDPRTTDYLLGLFEYSHMDFNVDRDKVEEDETKEKKEGDPSLADMTRKALSILMKNQKGFFLFIEGGRIDHGHHNNNPYRALDETLEMETALLAALERVNPAETLVVVTADHGHVMTFGGQSTPRGHPILGADSVISDVDDLTYTTILYGSGPGHSEPRTLPSNGTKFIAKHDLVHGAAVPKMWSTHGGEDVPVYALGPMATILFAGVVEQSYIAHAIAYAACLAHHSHRCISNNTIEKKFKIPLTAPTSFKPIGGPSSGRVFIAFSSWLRRVWCEDGPPMGPKLVGDVTGLLSVIQNCIQPEVTQEPVADETRNDESRKRNIVVASSVMSDERIHSSAQIFKPFVIFTYYIKFVSLCLVTNYLSKG